MLVPYLSYHRGVRLSVYVCVCPCHTLQAYQLNEAITDHEIITIVTIKKILLYEP